MMQAAASNHTLKIVLVFGLIALALASVGYFQSWSVALAIFNLCIISAIMALGVNIQWGYAGLFNVGTMGFAALGGVAAVLVSMPPVAAAWSAGGINLLLALIALIATITVIAVLFKFMPKSNLRTIIVFVVALGGYLGIRNFYDPAVNAIEAVDSAKTGYLGGLGLPILLAWPVGGLFAAAVAWLIGKIALGLRSDYLAIATLGISEILVAVMKNEDWLTRGVKNVTGLPRPVPYEVELQSSPWFVDWVQWFNADTLAKLADADRAKALQQMVVEGSSLFVKLAYSGLFLVILVLILTLSVLALNSPWGRMMRAIRDNEVSANAMGKNITRRHLQVFVLGSAVIGIAGAMITTLDGQFTPGTYNPLRFTFLIWVMVIVGGSGSNIGSVIGGFIIWFAWIEAEPMGLWLMDTLTTPLAEDNALRIHLLNSAQHMRLMVMGLVLLVVLRYSPGGIIPERTSK